MRLFRLFRKSTPTPTPGAPPVVAQPIETIRVTLPLPREEVRRLIFDAVAAGDEQKLESLCHEHRDLILREASGWLEVPSEIRASAELSEWYSNGLRAISRFCAEKLRPSDAQAT